MESTTTPKYQKYQKFQNDKIAISGIVSDCENLKSSIESIMINNIIKLYKKH